MVEIVSSIFADGLLSQYIHDYEYREVQNHLAQAIITSWLNERHIVIEAGTGTGKTLGYLIPAALFALNEQIKVAIVTETKTLQQQIMLNELPLVAQIIKEITGQTLSYALCLGSTNYPCYRRLKHIIDTGNFDIQYTREIEYCYKILTENFTITRFDIQVSDAVWNLFCRQPELCAMHKCKYKHMCSYMEARKQWQKADLLVMNHYLFFANIASSKSLLPDFRAVVFDEAHSIERIASSQLGFIFDHKEMQEILQFLIHRKKGGSFIEQVLPHEYLNEAIDCIDHSLRQLIICKAAFVDIIKDKQTVRIRNPLKECIPLLDALEELLKLFARVNVDTLPDDLRLEFEYRRSLIHRAWINLGMATFMEDENYVYWLENDRSNPNNPLLCGQPIVVDSILRKEVLEYYEYICFISATLSVKRSFEFFKRSIGLDSADEYLFSSPFDFAKQLVLYIDKGNVDPLDEHFIQSAASKIKEIVHIVNGRCLVLFTSYTMLERMYEILRDEIPYIIFSQHQMSAAIALQEYIRCENAVLCGTHSFWQGIDLPGDLVRAVIITKLPFETPDNPVVQAKIEKMQQQGENPFIKYQLPFAVLLLKQGFGRLIRKSTDKGIVAILDSRIVNRNYGRVFIESLPVTTVVNSIEELKEQYKKL